MGALSVERRGSTSLTMSEIEEGVNMDMQAFVDLLRQFENRMEVPL